ncbi:MAG: cytochrome P450 [Gemmatimonadaceae bacterium]|nr:cytochrome P450 [Gemmatimonadaceae bacterium]
MAWVYAEPDNEVDRGVWRVSGYADGFAALTHRDLLIPGSVQTSETAGARREQVVAGDERGRVREQLDGSARLLLESACADSRAECTVELMALVCKPFGAQAAAIMLDMPAADVQRLEDDARVVWRDAAMARRPGASAEALRATAALANAFGADAVHKVQAFVALTYSLPALLGNVFAQLLEYPVSSRQWRDHPRQIVEELLRVAGPAKVVYRVVDDVARLDQTGIERGDVVAIDLESANHDSHVFPEPLQLNLARETTPHVAFGWTPHACLGAGAIRLALGSVVGAWMTTFGREMVRWTWRTEADDTLVTMRRMQRVDVTCV